MVLHTVNNTGELLTSCLRCVAPGDALLLIEDAVYAGASGHPQRDALEASGSRLYILSEDVAARGLGTRIDSAIECIDYAGFVRLAAQCRSVQSWY